MGSTANPYAALRQEQIIKEMQDWWATELLLSRHGMQHAQVEAAALCKFYGGGLMRSLLAHQGKSLEEMMDGLFRADER